MFAWRSFRLTHTCYLVFFASCYKCKRSQCCWTTMLRLWLFAENLKAKLGISQCYSTRIAAVGKHFSNGNKRIWSWYGSYFKSGSCCEPVANLIVKTVGFIPHTFMCEPMGRREIFLTFSLLVEMEGNFTNEFVSYVYVTEDWIQFQIWLQLYIWIQNRFWQQIRLRILSWLQIQISSESGWETKFIWNPK
jgi:hypothetical protein